MECVMDRIQFAQSIDTGNIDYTTAFMNYFDQIMGVYTNFTPGDYSTKIINTGDNILVLSMTFNNPDRLHDILNAFDQESRIISVYQRMFKYNVHQVSTDTVQLAIITEA